MVRRGKSPSGSVLSKPGRSRKPTSASLDQMGSIMEGQLEVGGESVTMEDTPIHRMASTGQLMGGVELGAMIEEEHFRRTSSTFSSAENISKHTSSEAPDSSEHEVSPEYTSAPADHKHSTTATVPQAHGTKARSWLTAPDHPLSLTPLNPAMETMRRRRQTFAEVMELFKLETHEIVPVMTYLMKYDHNELVSQAIGLMVRHFEQRRVLVDAGLHSFLLIKQHMIDSFGTFSIMLKQLAFLARRRRLFGDEQYQAAKLMSDLAEHCFSEPDAMNDGHSIAHRSQSTVSHSRRGFMISVDHTQGIFLKLVGRDTAHADNATLTLKDEASTSSNLTT